MTVSGRILGYLTANPGGHSNVDIARGLQLPKASVRRTINVLRSVGSIRPYAGPNYGAFPLWQLA